MTDYEFPGPDKVDYWQKLITEAIGQGTLKWTKQTDKIWVLSGACPRCKDSMSQVFQKPGTSIGPGQQGFQVEPAGRPATQSSKPSTFRDEVVCSCHIDPPHKKDVAGCGYGKGLTINIPMPTEGG